VAAQPFELSVIQPQVWSLWAVRPLRVDLHSDQSPRPARKKRNYAAPANRSGTKRRLMARTSPSVTWVSQCGLTRAATPSLPH